MLSKVLFSFVIGFGILVTTVTDTAAQYQGGIGMGYAKSGITSFVLPLRFVSFSALRLDKYIKVDWEVAEEPGDYEYFVERSTNGGSFSTMGTVRAQTYSSINTAYSFIDQNPTIGSLYYRIKVKEAGGLVYFSEVQSLAFSKSLIKIYPVPATRQLTIEGIASLIHKALEGFVLDASGAVIKKFTVHQFPYFLDTRSFPDGYYLLQLMSEGQVIHSSRFAVVK